jgi:hypothetical protein
MQKLLKIMGCCILLLAIIGCQDAGNVNKNAKAVADKRNKFPDFLAGVWKTDDGRWQITLGPDGSLKEIKYYFNDEPMVTSDGGGYDLFDDDDIRSVYVFGPYSTDYDPNSSRLSLEVKIDQFEVKRPMGGFTGWMVDKFEGPISNDKKTWNAQWKNTTRIEEFDNSSNDSALLIFKHIEGK